MFSELLPAARLDSLFARQARITPEAAALFHDGRSLSYAQLDRASNRVAHYLLSLGAGPETVVGVCLPRNLDMVAALLGILKSGAAYLPLDPRHPSPRLTYMLRDSGALLLLTQSPVRLDPGFPIRVVDLDAEAGAIARQSESRPAPRGAASDLAYIIYTSGSTGAPNGVMMEHSAGHLIAWAQQTFSAGELARVAATTSLTFDPSVFEIFAPLSLGGAAIIKAHAFEPFRADEKPTMLGAAPSVMSQLASMKAIPDSVRVLNLGGEVVHSRLVHELYRTSRAERIYNHYGPTEATTLTSVALMPRAPVADPSIGRPIPGARVYILDAEGHPCPEGVVGEIHIAGAILARGYLNRPDLTGERFVRDPLGPPGGRMYRTGDLGKWLPNGQIAFLGRRDHQIKLSGIRIELGEIEVALLRLPRVRQAAVLVEDGADGARHLVAYIETAEAMRPQDVRRSLSVWLPQHMIPAAYVFLARFPLTVAGKIDPAGLVRAGVVQREPAGNAASLRRDKPARDGRRPRGPVCATSRAVEQAWRRTLPHARGRNASPDPDVSWADAGGDSLRSLQLLLRLEQALGRRLDFDLISPDITPHELTRRLRAGTAGLAEGLEPEADARSMFLVPGLLGDEPILADFRRPFGAALRLQIVEPPELGTPGAVLRSLRETGRWVAREIALRQPDGPVRLGGYSFGAAVAYEAAAELLSTGRTIEMLLVLDAPLTELGAAVLPDHVRWQGRLLRAWGRSDLRRRALVAVLGRIGALTTSRVRRPLLSDFRGNAMFHWRPVPLPVPGLVVLSGDHGPAVRTRWTQLLPTAAMLELPAPHRKLFSPTSMALLKPALLQALMPPEAHAGKLVESVSGA